MEVEEEQRMEGIEEEYCSSEDGCGAETVFKSPETTPMLLPENWELILRDLPPPDFLTAMNTCVEWNQLMHTKKPHKLISFVFPHLLDYLPATDIIKCRSISKQFRSMIDPLLHSTPLSSAPFYSPDFEEGETPFWTHDASSLHSKIDWIRRQTRFETPNQLQAFLDWSSSLPPSSSPILSGHISLKLGRGGVDRPPDNGLTLSSFLASFGPQISSISIEIRGGLHQISIYRMFATLSHLPNLQVLRLHAIIPRGEVRFLPPPPNFPHLPKLESLNLTLFQAGCKMGDILVLKPFLHQYGNQLKIFSCTGRVLSAPQVSAEALNNLLPNLKALNVICVNPEMMIKLALVPYWKLERLQLVQYQERKCTLVDLIRVLNNFKESLVNLEIDLVLNPDERVDHREMEKLPKLRRVTASINHLEANWFWDFLEAGCESLEELHWKSTVPGGDIKTLQEEQVKKAKKAFGICKKLKKMVFWFTMAHQKNKPRVVMRD